MKVFLNNNLKILGVVIVFILVNIWFYVGYSNMKNSMKLQCDFDKLVMLDDLNKQFQDKELEFETSKKLYWEEREREYQELAEQVKKEYEEKTSKFLNDINAMRESNTDVKEYLDSTVHPDIVNRLQQYTSD